MAKNANLIRASKVKHDEFYTQIADIEREMKHYISHFKDKVIFCNCDDPEYSNFWRFFQLNFYRLGLKKLISTHYEENKPSYKMEIVSTNTDNGQDGVQIGIPDYVKTPLRQNGDFRSPECIEILKEADIVITNPPFSLFKEYISLLMEYDKKFIVIGSKNAITYKEVFPLIKENKIWLGYSQPKIFIQPDGSEKKFGNILWYTNLDIPKRHEPMLLGWKFEKGLEMGIYQKYDNYDAYNVDKVCQIPRDYDGVLGVPITFLDKYCPEQFEILNANDYRTSDNVPKKSHGLIKDKEGYIREREQPMLESASRELLAPGADGWHINGKRKYARIFVVLRHGFTPDNQGN